MFFADARCFFAVLPVSQAESLVTAGRKTSKTTKFRVG